MKKIKMPFNVEYILKTLDKFGYEAYIVGGCVRDSLMGRIPKDWDITTNAKPYDVIDIFENLGYKTLKVGLKHGTVTVIIKNENYEITTYRIDGEYVDGRHPDSVRFSGSLKEDLERRDLTINGLAFNSSDGIIDYFGGINDIKESVIRCIGKAEDRFNEDSLRKFRTLRFMAQLGFNIEEKTLLAATSNLEKLNTLSLERVRDELNKILLSDNPSNSIRLLCTSGMLNSFIPELEKCNGVYQHNPYHDKSVLEHILSTVDNVPTKLELRWTALLHDIAKPLCFTMDETGIGHFYGHADISSDMAQDILKRFKCDNKLIEKVSLIIKHHDKNLDTKKSIKKLLNVLGEESFRDLLKMREADIRSQSKDYYIERHNKVLRAEKLLEEILSTEECFSRKDLAIDGRDLISIGYKEGKEIGIELDFLLDLVLENPCLNNKDQLLEIAKKRGKDIC